MTTPSIIGLAGYAQSGKDTVGQILVEQHGYTRMAFADVLREALYALNPIICTWTHSRVATLVDAHGWDAVKVDYPEIRALLQRLGTEVGRNLLGPDVWVEAAMRKVEALGHVPVVFTDVRFPNEVLAVRNREGQVWRVERFGTGPANDHPSETALDDYAFEHRILNTSTIEHLHQLVHEAFHYGGAS